LSRPKLAFRAQRRLGELPLLGIEQEQIRHGSGQRNAALRKSAQDRR
jgi:hypothetical protein